MQRRRIHPFGPGSSSSSSDDDDDFMGQTSDGRNFSYLCETRLEALDRGLLCIIITIFIYFYFFICEEEKEKKRKIYHVTKEEKESERERKRERTPLQMARTTKKETKRSINLKGILHFLLFFSFLLLLLLCLRVVYRGAQISLSHVWERYGEP
eukprot:gene9552-6708_t